MQIDIETRGRMLPSACATRRDPGRQPAPRAAFPLAWLVAAVALAWPAPAGAATCNVPSGTYPTIQSAVGTASCSPIVVAAGTYAEAVVVDRSLVLTGAGSGSSFIQGGVEVNAGTVTVTGFHLSGAGDAMSAHSGAEVSGFDLEVVNGVVEPPLFADGFEDGTTNGWAAVVP